LRCFQSLLARGPLFCGFLIAGSGFLGCNAVLGIEEAQLDPDRAPSTGGSSSTPGTASQTILPSGPCTEANPNCGACINTQCSSALAQCLADASCRRALDQYRKCLGEGCDNDVTICAEESLFIDHAPLANCVMGPCLGSCQDTPLAGTCELLCACMESTCPDQHDPSCITTCMNFGVNGSDMAYCRFAHCQVAAEQPNPLNVSLHCPHAAGMNACLGAVNVDDSCPRQPTGFPCNNNNDECCSSNCASGMCLE